MPPYLGELQKYHALLLATNAISYSYPPAAPSHARGETAKPVLRSVTCAIVPGRVLAIVGPNGAGKSTLLKLMAGLLEHNADTSPALDDVAVASMSPLARARRIAYLPQQPAVPPGFTTREVVRFGATMVNDNPSEASIDDSLTRVDLAHSAAKPFAHLSAGQRQRAALARALVQLAASNTTTPKYLLADEPVSAQDPGHALATLTTIRQLAQLSKYGPVGVAIVLHDLSLATRFADDALVLTNEGTVAASGPVQSVLTPGVLAPVFHTHFVETAAHHDSQTVRTLVPMASL